MKLQLVIFINLLQALIKKLKLKKEAGDMSMNLVGFKREVGIGKIHMVSKEKKMNQQFISILMKRNCSANGKIKDFHMKMNGL